MRVDNLRWHPVRLGLRRVGANRWWVSRAGVVVGEVRHTEGRWTSIPGHEREVEGRNAIVYDAFGKLAHSSFVCAVLRVARMKGIWASSDGPQDFGTVHMLRVNVATRWFTVITKDEQQYIYEDFTIPEKLTDEQQAVLRRALTEHEKWRRSR